MFGKLETVLYMRVPFALGVEAALSATLSTLKFLKLDKRGVISIMVVKHSIRTQ